MDLTAGKAAMLTIRGLPDGGATFIFDDHPAHHRIAGKVEVSFSSLNLARAVMLAAQAMEADESIVLDIEHEGDEPTAVHYHLDGLIAHPGTECSFCEPFREPKPL